MNDHALASSVAHGGRLRALVLELWQRTRMDWGFVTDRLALTFRKEKWIGAHERRFVSETLYGLVRNLRRVDLAIERGRRAKQAPRDLERLIALLVLEQLIDVDTARAAISDLDWSAIAGVDAAIASERNAAKRIALAASLPDWLAARLVADWKDDAEPLARSLNQRAPMTVRANTLVNTRDELATALAPLATHAGKWIDTALIVDDRTNLFATEPFGRGGFEAQDEGSQLLAELAVPTSAKPLVVDYCAGAGGKTLALAARLGNRGRIVASDVDDGKLEELRRRARRAQVSNTRAIAIGELDELRGKADVVLVDAPCSGIGALRRNPEARWRLREDELPGFAKRQREIVLAAAELLAPGGQLVYATCSLLRCENEDV
ncbi:MAG TPA: RsmB/NOP family class I SAM-dependent RNA methyltransferase, partial [Kofleriaceae bacterium]